MSPRVQIITIFLAKNGSTYGCGYNFLGQLNYDLDSEQVIRKIIKIPGLSAVTQVSSGYTHSLFLLNDGKVVSCRNNYHC
jgi:alpha-tubulin suppressor-like RCC1 family protein